MTRKKKSKGERRTKMMLKRQKKTKWGQKLKKSVGFVEQQNKKEKKKERERKEKTMRKKRLRRSVGFVERQKDRK